MRKLFYFFILLLFLSLPTSAHASTLFNDDFTDANNTSILAHNSSYFIPNEADNSTIQNNKVSTATLRSSYSVSNLTPTNVCASIDILFPDLSENGIELITRANEIDNQSGYLAQIYKNGKIYFYLPDLTLEGAHSYIIPSSGMHNFKLCSINNTHTVYLDGNPQFQVTDNEKTTGGYIRFQLSAPSIVDDFLITDGSDLDKQPQNGFLNVPYFSQNDLPWGPMEYDDAKKLSFADPTMDRWGCAVTSAAMVLRYHKIDTFDDGTEIDPGTLNTWLMDHHGYLIGKDKDGKWYSYLSWPAISTLTKDLYNKGKAPVILQHERLNPSLSTSTTLDTDLASFPDILKVHNASTSGHFVVATGTEDNTYTINDPEWHVPTLSSFNNSYNQVDRFIPIQSNLSYIVAVTNPQVQILLEKGTQSTGEKIVNGTTTEYKDLSGAVYGYESPISNPTLLGTLESFGTGANVLLYPLPNEGNYTMTLSSNSPQEYTLNLVTFQTNGTYQVKTLTGVVSPDQPDTLTFNYSKTQPTDVTRNITFASTVQDIDELQSINFITNPGQPTALKQFLLQAEKAQQQGSASLVEEKLDVFQDMLNEMRKEKIIDDGYMILSNDLQALR